MAEPTCRPLVLRSSRASSTTWLPSWKHANVRSVRKIKRTTTLHLLHRHPNESAWRNLRSIKTKKKLMLAQINPVVLPALRIAATFFLLVNIIGGVYIFRNRHRFFDQDPNISEDIEP